MYLLIALSFAFRAAAAERLHGADENGLYGGGRGIRIADLPPCVFRAQVEALKPEARDRALRNLEAVAFHRNDLASLRADSEGGIYYACALEVPRADEPLPTRLWRAPAAAVSITNPPVYHSRPGSTNVLFLDFNGHVITNTMWNSDEGVPLWDCTPFDEDNDETAFSDLEQQHIREIWERVAEDFSPFDVDVTTEQPPAWNNRTGHALITSATDAEGRDTPLVYPGGVYGGLAYLDAFTNSLYSYNADNCRSPAWIRQSLNRDLCVQIVAETISHELGHNLGLSHDGTASGVEYHAGFAATTNAPSWGPLMGSVGGRDVTQWSRGEYYNANQKQDDLGIIALRLGYIADDHGGSNASATAVSPAGYAFSVTGRVEQTLDRDVFALTTGVGIVSVAVYPFRATNLSWGANADLVLLLCASNGTVLASNNTPADVKAVLPPTAVAAGTYYVHVYPAGAGSPSNASSSGYTVYGCLGTYRLAGTVAPAEDTVVVTSPGDGSRLFVSNATDIAWLSGFTNPVRIELWRGGALHTVIATNLANQGAHSWTVPATAAPGYGYRVRVARADNPAVYGESDGQAAVYGTPVSLLVENFDGGGTMPAGWSEEFVTNSVSWRLQNGGGASGSSSPAAAYSGSNNAHFFSSQRAQTRLVLPTLELGEVLDPRLTYRLCMADIAMEQLRVLYRTNALAEWTPLTNYYGRYFTSWVQHSFPLSNAAPDCTLAFEGRAASSSYGVCVDDVEVTGIILTGELLTNRLEVASDLGLPDPPAGTNWLPVHTPLAISAGTSPLSAGSTQFVCAGWTGTGDVPASGTEPGLILTLHVASSLAWRWRTNYYLDCSAGSDGTVLGATGGWYAAGASITVTAAPDPYCGFAGWGGDTAGDTNDPVMTVTLDGPRVLAANFAPRRAVHHGTPEAWLAEHYPETGDLDAVEISDTDGDGLEAWQEYIAGTLPGDAQSVLKLESGGALAEDQWLLRWQVISDRSYSLWYFTNLLAPEDVPVITGRLAAADGVMAFTNALPPEALRGFYRLTVRRE